MLTIATQQHTQTQNTSINRLKPLRVLTSNVRGVIKNWDSIKQLNLNNYDILLFNEIWQVRDYEKIILDDFNLANIALYRAPSGNKLNFVDTLQEWVSTLNNKDLYIAGDFNLNQRGNDIEHFNQIEASTGLKPRINEITRIESNNCIDNILTTFEGTHICTKISIADHLALKSVIYVQIKREPLKKFKYREMKESNWCTFKSKISTLPIRGNNIESKWSNLLYDIKQIVIASFPEKQSNIKYSFCMSQGLLKSKNIKNNLLRKYKRGEIEKEVYTRYNKIYRKLVLKEQETAFKTNLDKSGNDSKKKWNVLKTELKIKNSSEEISKLLVNGSTITTPAEIANKFKTHF